MPDAAKDLYMKQVFQFDVAARQAGAPSTSVAPHRPSAHAPKAKLTTEQRLARDEDWIRGETKTIIGEVGARLLQQQYTDMLAGLERAKSARFADIESWTPDQTPTGGNLLLKICGGLAGVAARAFPEIAFLDIAKQGVELVVRGKDQLDRGVEPSKAELEAVKKAAKGELDSLVAAAKRQASKRQDHFQQMIETAVERLSPEEIDALQGMRAPKLVGDFVRDRLGIRRGEYHTPGIVTAMELQVMNDFNRWVEEDFKHRKAGQASHEVAADGGHSWEAMSLAELYRLAQAGDEVGLGSALRNLNGRRDRKTPPIPEGWYEAQLRKLTEKIKADFDAKFAFDMNRLIMEQSA